MPRALPAALTSALDSGSFTAYIAIGKRNYDADPPTALVDYTTLITNILYYKYDGLELIVKYASANLPVDDGLIVGDKYYIERGVKIAGTPSTIKSASLRFDDYSINRQVVTAYFSLFSPDEKPDAIDGHDTYTNVLTALNPNTDILGTVDFLPTPENTDHWGYNFYPSGKQVIPKSYMNLLSHLRQKYLIQVVDNSDDDNEDEIQYYHLRSPINTFTWQLRSSETVKVYGFAYSPTLDLLLAVGIDGSNTATVQTSNDQGVVWNPTSYPAIPFRPYGACWSPELEIFVMVGTDATGTQAAATSPDGTTWTARTAPDDLYSVIWIADLSLFVAVGTKIVTSPDGITWTEQAMPFAGILEGLVYADTLGLIVATGYYASADTCAATSEDGVIWTARTTPERVFYKGLAWSSELTLLVAVSETGTQRVMTSPDGITWTGRTHAGANTYETVCWSPTQLIFYAAAYWGELMYSSDGISWTEETQPCESIWQELWWCEELVIFCLGAIGGTSGYNIITSLSSITPSNTIEQGDVTLLKNGSIQAFLWRDELESIHLTGEDNSIVHNLGYLESTDSPPASYLNADRGKATVGIHLKYKSGDVIRLKVKNGQSATYHAQVTEILDPRADIGWRCEIELIERFNNTNAGALPGTIERIAAYTPLVTTNFNGMLDSSVNNLQAFADRVDDVGAGLVNGWVSVSEQWTRTGNYTFTIPTDYTTKYGKGVRVRWTDGSTRKYGVVISSSYASGTDLTTVTLATNADYSIVATTVVGRYITRAENPEGFPHLFNFTPTISSSAGAIANPVVSTFKVSFMANEIFFYIDITFDLTTATALSIITTLPVTPSFASAFAASCRDASSGAVPLGIGITGPANPISFRLASGSNWSVGTTKRAYGSGSIAY